MDDLLKFATQPVEPPLVQELWGIFNDPQFFEPRFADGTIHPMLREKLLEEPLWTSDMPGPAKRFVEWQNRDRTEQGRIEREGPVILRVQEVIRKPWRTVTGQEYNDINDGRAPSGR